MLDEASTGFIADLAASGLPPLHELSPREARAAGAGMAELYGRGPRIARVEEVELGPMRLRLLVPSERARGVIVYYHGGGWVLGALDQFDALGRRLAAGTGCAVVLVDYRLAPEHRYPAAVDDAWTALKWTAAKVEEIAGRRVPLIVAGDSAGGSLAAVVAQRAREAGPEIALQVLVYPVTDCDLDRDSYLDPENQLIVGRARWRGSGITTRPTRGPLEPGCLAAARSEPRRPAARGRAHGPARRAAGRGRSLRRAARRKTASASSTSASTARCTASS